MVEYDILLYMVDYLERKKQEVSRKHCRISEKIKWHCMKTFYFWCNEKGIEDAGQILNFFSSL